MAYIGVTKPNQTPHNRTVDMGYIFLIDIRNVYHPFGRKVNSLFGGVPQYVSKRKRYLIRKFFKHSCLRREKEGKVGRKSYFDTIIKSKKVVSGASVK